MIDSVHISLAFAVHLSSLITKNMQSVSCFTLPGYALHNSLREKLLSNTTDEAIVKKFIYSIIGIFLLVISGSVLSGALELHSAISDRVQHFQSFPESGWLIVLGSLLITSASFLRRRRAARAR